MWVMIMAPSSPTFSTCVCEMINRNLKRKRHEHFIALIADIWDCVNLRIRHYRRILRSVKLDRPKSRAIQFLSFLTEVPRVVSAPRSGFALVLCGFPLLRGRKVRSVHWERRLSQQDAFAESRSKILRWWSLGSVSMTIGTPPTVMVARAIVPSTAMIPRQS